MPRQPGAYKLGKALLDNIVGLADKVEVNKDGRILLNSNVNYMLVRDAILDALRDSGFMPMWFGMIAMLPPAQPSGSAFIEVTGDE